MTTSPFDPARIASFTSKATLKDCLILSTFFNPLEPSTPHPISRYAARVAAQRKLDPSGEKISPGTNYNSIQKMIKSGLITRSSPDIEQEGSETYYMPKSNRIHLQNATKNCARKLIEFNHVELSLCLNLISTVFNAKDLAPTIEELKLKLIKVNHYRSLKIEREPSEKALMLAPEILLLSSGEFLVHVMGEILSLNSGR